MFREPDFSDWDVDEHELEAQLEEDAEDDWYAMNAESRDWDGPPPDDPLDKLIMDEESSWKLLIPTAESKSSIGVPTFDRLSRNWPYLGGVLEEFSVLRQDPNAETEWPRVSILNSTDIALALGCFGQTEFNPPVATWHFWKKFLAKNGLDGQPITIYDVMRFRSTFLAAYLEMSAEEHEFIWGTKG